MKRKHDLKKKKKVEQQPKPKNTRKKRYRLVIENRDEFCLALQNAVLHNNKHPENKLQLFSSTELEATRRDDDEYYTHHFPMLDKAQDIKLHKSADTLLWVGALENFVFQRTRNRSDYVQLINTIIAAFRKWGAAELLRQFDYSAYNIATYDYDAHHICQQFLIKEPEPKTNTPISIIDDAVEFFQIHSSDEILNVLQLDKELSLFVCRKCKSTAVSILEIVQRRGLDEAPSVRYSCKKCGCISQG